MNTTPEHNQKFVTITFAAVYPHYVKKVESKGRTLAELHQVINWLTGFDEKKLQGRVHRTELPRSTCDWYA